MTLKKNDPCQVFSNLHMKCNCLPERSGRQFSFAGAYRGIRQILLFPLAEDRHARLPISVPMRVFSHPHTEQR